LSKSFYYYFLKGGPIIYASFTLRLKAFAIDYLLILLYLAMLIILNVFIFPEVRGLFTGSVIIAQLTGFLLVTLPVSLYFIISDSSVGKQSFGKRVVGIQVVNQNGDALPIWQSTIRNFIKFIPWELSHFIVYRFVYIGEGEVPVLYYLIGGMIYLLMFVYILTAIFTKKKQSLYDIAVKSNVVKVDVKTRDI